MNNKSNSFYFFVCIILLIIGFLVGTNSDSLIIKHLLLLNKEIDSKSPPIFSSIIALVAIYFTWQQSKSNRLHNELSVRPAICSNFITHTDKLSFNIKNKGLGPAKVDEFKFYYKKRLISFDEFEKITNKKYRVHCDIEQPPITSNQTKNSYIGKDETVIILQLIFNDTVNQNTKNDIANEIESLFDLEFEYTSFYNETIKDKFKFTTRE